MMEQRRTRREHGDGADGSGNAAMGGSTVAMQRVDQHLYQTSKEERMKFSSKLETRAWGKIHAIPIRRDNGQSAGRSMLFC